MSEPTPPRSRFACPRCGKPPRLSWLYLLPSTLGMGVLGTVAGRVARRYGSKLALITGSGITASAGTTSAWTLDELAAGTGALAPADPAAAPVPPAPPAGVVGVDLVTDEGATVTLAWALVAEVHEADGTLFSVLDPVPVPHSAPDVAVREDPRLGTR